MTAAAVVHTNKPAPELSVPTIIAPAATTGDDTIFTLADDARTNSKPKNLTILIFYRGLHCPLCKDYIKDVEENYQKALDCGMEIIAISMDTREKAMQFSRDVASMMEIETLKVPIAYGLTESQARSWGLYISAKREGSNDEPAVFSEPGVFAIRPNDNTVFMAQVQSAPFTRPRISELMDGLLWAVEHNYPARGTLT